MMLNETWGQPETIYEGGWTDFLYRCPHINTAGAIKVTKNNITKNNHITVRDRSIISQTEKDQSPAVTKSQMKMGDA